MASRLGTYGAPTPTPLAWVCNGYIRVPPATVGPGRVAFTRTPAGRSAPLVRRRRPVWVYLVAVVYAPVAAVLDLPVLVRPWTVREGFLTTAVLSASSSCRGFAAGHPDRTQFSGRCGAVGALPWIVPGVRRPVFGAGGLAASAPAEGNLPGLTGRPRGAVGFATVLVWLGWMVCRLAVLTVAPQTINDRNRSSGWSVLSC